MESLTYIVIYSTSIFYLILLVTHLLQSILFCYRRYSKIRMIESEMSKTRDEEIIESKKVSYTAIEKEPIYDIRDVTKSRPTYTSVKLYRTKFVDIPYESEEEYTEDITTYESRPQIVYDKVTKYRDDIEYYTESVPVPVMGYNSFNTYTTLRYDYKTEYRSRPIKVPYDTYETRTEYIEVPITKQVSRKRKVIKYRQVEDGIEEYYDKVPDGNYESYTEKESYIIGYKDREVIKYKVVDVGTGQYRQVPIHDREELEERHLEGYTYSHWLSYISIINIIFYYPYLILCLILVCFSIRSSKEDKPIILWILIPNILIGIFWELVLPICVCIYARQRYRYLGS